MQTMRHFTRARWSFLAALMGLVFGPANLAAQPGPTDQLGDPLPEGALAVTWRGLREVGNLSSTSVLLVLQETMAEHRPPVGSYGLLLAMGPGFCSELVLLHW